MVNRIETDPMGEVEVPADKYYGASTQRAVENFRISTLRFPRRFIWAQALVKSEAARVNADMGLIPPDVAEAIRAAADRVMSGELDDHFEVDIFQTGSGTSSNMNMNEVLGNLATEIMGGELGSKLAHPNDHVNACQSSNDTIPTAIQVASVDAVSGALLPALKRLHAALVRRADEFDHVVKTSRTHLMDAPPVRMGQVFAGYAKQIEKSITRVNAILPELAELPLGSTVNGTGINAHPQFAARTIAAMSEVTGYPFVEAADHFEALGAKDNLASAAGAFETVALSLFKIVNDIRWLASGPAGGIGELKLKPLQPGSSIIPGLGKVNAVICEAIMMVAAQAVGNQAAIAWGVANGNFELNVMAPVIGHNLIEMIEILGTSANALAEKVVEDGLEVDEDRCREIVDRNLTIVTALTPEIGYDAAADVVRSVQLEGGTVRQAVLERNLLPVDDLDNALKLHRLTEGGRV